jgi:hypothetical protein
MKPPFESLSEKYLIKQRDSSDRDVAV